MSVYVDLILVFLNILNFKDEPILNTTLLVVSFSTSYFYEWFEYIVNENLARVRKYSKYTKEEKAILFWWGALLAILFKKMGKSYVYVLIYLL